MRHAVFLIRPCDIVGGILHLLCSISHGNAQSCKANHREIIVSVTTRDDLFTGEMKTVEQSLKRQTLVYTRRHTFQKEAGRTLNIQFSFH